MDIQFEYEKLSRADQKIYDAMNDYEKEKYKSTWLQLEKAKMKLIQQKHASKEGATREKKALAEKERKERNHRLIERGAMLESFIAEATDFSNEEIKEILINTVGTEYAKRYVEEIRARHLTHSSVDFSQSYF